MSFLVISALENDFNNDFKIELNASIGLSIIPNPYICSSINVQALKYILSRFLRFTL